MATFIRGQQGLIEMITDRRDRLQARLNNNDNPNNLAVNRMKRRDRDELQGEIYGLNMVLSDLVGTTILTEADYDQRIAPPECPECGYRGKWVEPYAHEAVCGICRHADVHRAGGVCKSCFLDPTFDSEWHDFQACPLVKPAHHAPAVTA